MGQASSRQGGNLLYFVTFLGLIGVLLSARSAQAQALPLVPDPIDTSELMEIADQLDLSDQQRLALPAVHDDYLLRFRNLRDGEMQKFEDAMIDIAMQFIPTGFSIPPRDDIEDLIDQYERLLGRIESVDRSLFDGMSPLLTDSQLLKLERVRTLRKLQMYELAIEMGGDFNSGAGVLLTEFLEDRQLDPGVRHQVDLTLAEYETKLYSEVRDLHDAIRDGIDHVLDLLDELGLRQMTMPEMMQLAQDEDTVAMLRARFDELSKPFQKAASDVSTLNLRTFRRIVPLLPEEEAEPFRQTFYRRAYGEVWSDPNIWRDRYRRALQLDGLSEELEEVVRQQLSASIERDDRLMDSIIELAEESRSYRTAAMLEEDVPVQHEERMGQLQTQRLELSTQAAATLSTLIGPELVAELDGTGESESGDSQVARSGGGGGEAAAQAEAAREQAEARRPSWERDEVAAPDPMTVESVQEMVRVLGWGPDHEAVVDALFDDYRDRFESLVAEVDARGAGDGETPGEDGSAGSNRDEREEQLLSDLKEIESRFFEDLAALAADPAQQADLHRLRLVREREALEDLVESTGYARGDDGDHNVDLVAIALDVVPVEARPEASAVLDQYQAVMLPMVRDYFDVTRDLRRQFRSLMRIRAKGGEGSEIAAEAIMKKQRETTQRMARLRRELGETNERYLQEFSRTLPSDLAQDLQWRCEQAAYPEMFRESSRTQKLVDSVLELPDLSAAQREQVQEIAASFQRRFFEISRRMIDLRRAQGAEFERMGTPTRAAIEHQIAAERLEFDRDEAEARARMHLRLVLTDAQAEVLPELAHRGR